MNPRPRQDGTMLNSTHSTLLMARNNIDFIHVSSSLSDVKCLHYAGRLLVKLIFSVLVFVHLKVIVFVCA